MIKGQRAGVLALLGAAVLWGVIGTATRFSFRDGIRVEDVAFWRAAIAGVGFLLFSFLRRGGWSELHRLPIPVWRSTYVFALFGVVGLGYSVMKAIQTGGAGFAAVFLYLAPFFVALWGRLFLEEKLTTLKLFSLLLTVGGVAIVGFYGGSEVRFSLEAIIWGVISAFSYSLFYLFSRAYFRDHSAVLLNGLAFTIAAAVLFGVAYAKFGGLTTDYTPAAVGGVFVAGVFSSLIAYGLYSIGMQKVEATRASIICSLEPVVALFSAYLVWGERLSVAGYVGATVVVTGVSLSAISERETPRSA